MEILEATGEFVRKAEHPWEQWLVCDGKPRVLRRGDDFTETVAEIRHALIRESAQRGVDINIKSLDDGVVFQLYYHGQDMPKLPELSDARVRYPWADWFDGQWHELRRGRDFTQVVSGFRAFAYKEAKNRQLKLKTETTTRGQVLYICAYKDGQTVPERTE